MTTESVARAYITAVSSHDLAPLDRLFDSTLTASFAGRTFSKTDWIDALARLLPALERNENLEIFAELHRACVAYDFVTNTAAGTIRCVELLTVTDDRITSIELLLDRVAFAPVNEELAARAAA